MSEKPKKIKFQQFLVTLADEYLGIRHWRHVAPVGLTPRFHVYVYLGYDEKHRLHFFRSYTTNTVLWKTYEELKTLSFGPFLLDFKKIAQALDELDRGERTA